MRMYQINIAIYRHRNNPPSRGVFQFADIIIFADKTYMRTFPFYPFKPHKFKCIISAYSII